MPALMKNGTFSSLCCALLQVLILAAACDLPRDPEGTTEGVRSKVMRVGVMHHPPWAIVGDEGTRISGIEVTLVKRFAEELDAHVEWHAEGESLLMESLKNFELDLVVGGLNDSSPWAKRVGLTQAYVEAPLDPCAKAGTTGAKRVGHVFAVPPGENAWLLKVEGFLDRSRTDAERLIGEACGGEPIGKSPETSNGVN